MSHEPRDARYALVALKNRLDAEFLTSHFSHCQDVLVSWIVCDLESCALESAKAAPALVILDAGHPNNRAIAIAVQIMRTETPPAILLLDAAYNDVHATAAETIGAAYCTRKSAVGRLENAVRLLLYAPFLRPNRQNGLIEDWSLDRSEPQQGQLLSVRELQVLSMLTQGSDSNTIANHLGLHRSTVANHRRNIKRKLNVRNTAELVTVALQSGLTET